MIVALRWGTTVALLKGIVSLALALVLLLLAIVITTTVLVRRGTTVMRHDESRSDFEEKVDRRGGMKDGKKLKMQKI